jgi:hypothetical protein
MWKDLLRRLAGLATWPRLVALALLSATALPMALNRPIDGDEGFFLMAARLFSKGLAPYHDFFFIHGPAIPYLFGAWFRVVGPGWYAARALSGLISVVIGMALFEHLLRATGRRGWALFGAALFATTGLALGWFSPVKSLGISALCAFCGMAVLSREGKWSILVAGVLLGLTTSARLYMLATVPCAVLFLLRRQGWSRTLRRDLVQLGIGLAIGSLPLIWVLLRDHQAFVFGTVEYHALRDVRSAGVVGDWAQKRETLLSILGFESPDGGGAIQFLGLVVLALGSLFSSGTPRNSPFAPVWITLFVVSILPTPSYTQYFCLLVPFLIVEAVVLLASLPVPPLRPALALGLAAYVGLGIVDVRRFLVTGANVPGLWSPERIARWSIPQVVAVAKAIDEQNLPVGASWWPGYFVSTRTPIHIDLANDFGMVIADKVTEARRRRFHIVTHGEMAAMIERHDPPLFVEGNWAYTPNAQSLPARGYQQARTVGPVRIWVAH